MSQSAEDAELSQLRDIMMATSLRVSSRECPSPQTLTRLVCGEAIAQEYATFAEHCADCPSCFQDFAVAKQLHAALQKDCETATNKQPSAFGAPGRLSVVEFQGPMKSSDDGQAGVRPEPLGRVSRWKRRASAAGLLSVAAAAGVFFYFTRASESPVPASRERPTLRGAQSLQVPGFIKAVMKDGTISWHRPTPSASTQLFVYDEDLREIYHRANLLDSAVTIDSEILDAVAGQEKIYWQIRVRGADGQEFESVPVEESTKEWMRYGTKKSK